MKDQVMVVIKPDGRFDVVLLGPREAKLEELQQAVQGYIEPVAMVNPITMKEQRAYVNEEGRFKRLSWNAYATVTVLGPSMIYGNLVFVCDLPDSQREWLKKIKIPGRKQ